eukprot:evm.model.scf_75.3 EVM.evm.TU.scf_75.3   scf_75:14532-21992(-)
MARDTVTVDQAYQESVGEFGAGQQWLWLLTSLIWAACSIQVYLMLFAEIDPFEQHWWRCVPGAAECSDWYKVGMKAEDVAEGICSLKRDAWEWTQSAYSVVSEFDLICDDSWKKGFGDSVFFFGVLVGAGLFGFLSDKYGRRKAMYAATGIAGVSTLLSGLAPSYWFYVSFKLLAGIGFGGEGLASFVLMTELVGPTWRGKAGIATQFFFTAGECLLAALAFAIHGWRDLSLVAAIITISYFVTWLSIPESPKWLLVNGRKGEALSILGALASANKTKVPEVPLTDVAGGSTESAMSDVVAHPKLRKYLAIMVYSWCIVSCVYYGISLSLDALPGSIYTTFFWTSFVEFPAYALIVLLVDKVGRKPIFTWGFVIGSVACLTIGMVSDDEAIVMAMLGKFATAGVFNLAFLYTTELFPTVVRNGTLGMASLAGRMGGIAAPQIVYAGKAMSFPSFSFIVFGVTGLVAGVYSTMLPETLGMHPPDTLDDVPHSGPTRNFKLSRPGTWFKRAGKEYTKVDEENLRDAMSD